MRKKIRIAYIIDQLNVGGTEKQLVETIRRLDRNRFAPYLICLRPSQYLDEVDTKCRKRVLRVTSLLSINGTAKFLKLVDFLKREKVDIVQTFFFDSTVFGVLAAKLAGTKKIIVSRRDLGFWYTPHLLLILRLINLLVDRFLVNSKAVRECIAARERVPRRKIDVIYNGIDLPPPTPECELTLLRRKLGISNFDKVVGIVANLNREVKRVDIFIKAAKIVLQRMENVIFVIVGDGHLRPYLQDLARKLGIAKRMIFVGRQDNVYPFISIFDVGVLCSDSEGLSNSLLEYGAAGIPSVVTDNGGNREIRDITGCGAIYLVRPNSDVSLGKAVLQVLGNLNEVLKEAEIQKQKVVAEFSWEIRIKEIAKYYHFLKRMDREELESPVSPNQEA